MVPSIAGQNLDNFGTNIQGLLINIDWNRKTLQDLKRLSLSDKLLRNGIIFLWSSKDYLAEILEIMGDKGCKYIENICVAKIDASSLLPAEKLQPFDRLTQEQRIGFKSDFLRKAQACTDEANGHFLLSSENNFFKCCKLVLLMFSKVKWNPES